MSFDCSFNNTSLSWLNSASAKDTKICNQAGKVCADTRTREVMGTDDPNAHNVIIRGSVLAGAGDFYKVEWIVLCNSNEFAANQVQHTQFKDGEITSVSPWKNANDSYHTFDKETQWLKKAACKAR